MESNEDFFKDMEISADEYKNEFNQAKEEYEFTEGDEAEYVDAEPVEDREPPPDKTDFLAAEAILTFIDDSRAIAASLYSGQPKEKYLFYDNEASRRPMVMSLALVFKKYSFSWGPEFMLVVGLLISSAYIAKMASDDRKAAKERAQREASAKQAHNSQKMT